MGKQLLCFQLNQVFSSSYKGLEGIFKYLSAF